MALVVLAKAPEPGRVKTRLCPPAVAAEAADIAAAALLDTLAAVRATPGGRPVLALAGRLPAAARADELAAAVRDVPVVAQRGTDLGARIAAAHADAGLVAPGLPTLQIGMDTPQVDARLLARCADALLAPPAPDAVLGPAADGGWWALGLRDPGCARVIAEVPTSRPDTGRRTLEALRSAGLRVALLPTLRDVDTAADAVAVSRAAPGTRFAAAVHAVPALCRDTER
ncbi:glycosyltransferase involved in cell wall biogenesis [Pseudonocardia sp. CNS-139]|nr:glycosyltransferase involved in cell wall biogenesis [Pseudonocardia sp. CNS-139]